MGACARLIAGHGVPGSYFSAPVIGMSAAWIIVNLVIAVVGFAPGMGDTPVAWEAHLFGFAAGLVLIDPFTWLARGPRRS
jgi:membrane associated rhomboid family serine protease